MFRYLTKILLVLIIFFLSGCGGTIQNYSTLNKLELNELVASKGSILFRIDKTSDLPNAFGKADIYGGKVDRGYTEVKLLDIKDNILKLEISDVSKNSAETTKDRYSNKSLIAISTQINGSNNNEANVVYFDTTKDNLIVISDVELTILKITSFSVYYKLRKN